MSTMAANQTSRGSLSQSRTRLQATLNSELLIQPPHRQWRGRLAAWSIAGDGTCLHIVISATHVFRSYAALLPINNLHAFAELN